MFMTIALLLAASNSAYEAKINPASRPCEATTVGSAEQLKRIKREYRRKGYAIAIKYPSGAVVQQSTMQPSPRMELTRARTTVSGC